MAAAGKASFGFYMEKKFNRLEEKAWKGGLNAQDLINGHDRFAIFARVARAFEVCSDFEVVDFLADALIGGIKSGDVEKRPDFVHMAISALNGMTKAELSILVFMHGLRLYLDSPEHSNKESNREALVSKCRDDLNIEPPMLSAVLNRMVRTGLVTAEAPGVGDSVRFSNKLTPLARELFAYISIAKRLTE